ncbi:Cell polarity protein [Fasciolopsis buskii]|uniref:Cell polarity protein n=1 Tax=Fasciolopsis buskii TaxID=27845 RepID=A0A8E0VG21_9TREM|nr:Cell polarity protein [Fasciolopsis buski]
MLSVPSRCLFRCILHWSHFFVRGSETLTCMAVGDKVVYVGSSVGTLRQLAREGGRLCLGEESLTACTASMVVETVPLDKRQDVHVDSPIVSLAMQPEGNHLLIAYASGCVAVAIPQPPLNATAAEPRSADTAPTAEVEPTTPNTEENPADTNAPSAPAEVVNEPQAEEVAEPPQSPVTGAPATGSGERRATLRLKGLTRSLRGTDSAKPEAETEPKLTVPPAPRISHLLIRDQVVESAAWRVTSVGSLSTEVVIAYGDGAFQIWPIVAAVSQQPQEPIIVSKREPPSTPYGPLPCGAIKKILINPGEHGGMLTAFSGGLPRPEFQDRHAVTVMQGQEHHVCFQFGSEIKDFVFIPKKGALAEMFTTESDCNPSRSFAVSALLVLTDRELLAIDLIRSDWPVIQLPHLSCMNLSPVTAVTLLSQVSTFIFGYKYSQCYDWF